MLSQIETVLEGGGFDPMPDHIAAQCGLPTDKPDGQTNGIRCAPLEPVDAPADMAALTLQGERMREEGAGGRCGKGGPTPEERCSDTVPDSPEIASREEGLMGELRELVAETAPRRFGLCAVDLDEEDAVVLGWGLAFDDHAVVYSSGSRAHARFTSPDSAVRLLARRGDVRLLWVDSASDATAVDDPY